MRLSTENLTLSPDDAIDLQLHTVNSDGKWTPETLIDHLKAEGFALAAITDHDRADIALELQRIAIEKQFPLLVAVEVSSQWKDQMVDFLCFGFNPEENALLALTEEIKQAQRDITTAVMTSLRANGYAITDDEFANTLATPSSQHLNELIVLVEKYKTDDVSLGRVLGQAGFRFASIEPSRIVAAAHASDALCILAHPGRDDGFMCFDTMFLDELRAEAPIDGIEAYYPKHTDEQTQQYLAYATEHDLLVSSGSDSHSAEKLPIKYKAEYSQQLLQRLGIQFG